MAETKYGKYIVTRPKATVGPKFENEEEAKRMAQYMRVSMYVDEEVVPGAYYLMGTWLYKVPEEVPAKGEKGAAGVEHEHDFDEYIGFLGTNPDDPFDLGGEIELWLGGEKHMLTESCAVFIPAGLKHCPVRFKRIDRPIWFFATGPTKMYEKDVSEETK